VRYGTVSRIGSDASLVSAGKQHEEVNGCPKGSHKIRRARMIGSETIWEHALRDFSSAQFVARGRAEGLLARRPSFQRRQQHEAKYQG